MAKNSGGPNLSAISASSGAKNVISTIEKSAPDERRGEGGGQRLAALPLPGQRVAVEGGRHRPRLARDVEQDRGDGPAEQRAPVDATSAG